MKIKIESAQITLTVEEASTIYYALRDSISAGIRTHWVHHPSVYEDQTADKRHMMAVLSRITGDNVQWDENQLRKELEEALRLNPPTP